MMHYKWILKIILSVELEKSKQKTCLCVKTQEERKQMGKLLRFISKISPKILMHSEVGLVEGD